MKLKIFFLFCSIFILTGCSNSFNQNKIPSFKKTEKSNSVGYKNIDSKVIANEEFLNANLQSISENIRNYGSPGELKTSEFLKSKLIEFGYNVKFQDFDIYKQDAKTTIQAETQSIYLNNNFYNSKSLGKARNILATQKVFDPTKKTIYLTAHYDTTDDTVGVVDNASGSIALLEIARMLSDYNDQFNIGIVFFSAEEYFRSGSRYFVSNLSEQDKKNILGCINIDMVGEKGKGNLVMNTVSGEQNIMSLMINNLTKNKFELISGASSDDLSFYMAKIPIINLCNDYAAEGSYSDAENNLSSIDLNQIKDLCDSIANSLIEFDLDSYSNLLTSSISISSENTLKNIGDFKLIDKKGKFLDNGYDIETIYTYEDTLGNIYTVNEKSSKFIPSNDYKDLTLFDDFNTDGYKLKQSNENAHLIYLHGFHYGEIDSNTNSDNLLKFYKEYYSAKNL